MTGQKGPGKKKTFHDAYTEACDAKCRRRVPPLNFYTQLRSRPRDRQERRTKVMTGIVSTNHRFVETREEGSSLTFVHQVQDPSLVTTLTTNGTLKIKGGLNLTRTHFARRRPRRRRRDDLETDPSPYRCHV